MGEYTDSLGRARTNSHTLMALSLEEARAAVEKTARIAARAYPGDDAVRAALESVSRGLEDVTATLARRAGAEWGWPPYRAALRGPHDQADGACGYPEPDPED